MSVMPWVSSGFPPSRLGFPQVSVPLVCRFCGFAVGFHRYVFIACLLRSGVAIDLLMISLWICYAVRYALQAGMVDASVGGSVGFPADVLQVSIGFPASFLRVSNGMLLGFLQVSCGFPVGLLLFPQMGSH